MDVTLVTEDNPSKLQNKMSQCQETPKDPGEMDEDKAKNKMSSENQQKMNEDPRSKLIDKNGIMVL